MTFRTQTPGLLSDSPVPVRAKLGAAWTSLMFLYVYVDIFNFFKPGVVEEIRNGLIWEFEVTATLLTIMFVSMSIPALMVVLSVALPARVNRATNLVVAALLIPYTIFNAAGSSWEWAGFYGISIGVELVLLAYVLRAAWTWPRQTGKLLPNTRPDGEGLPSPGVI